MADFKIQGLEPVLAKMKDLTPTLKKKALRSAGTKAMRVVRDAARRGAAALDDPKSPSNIAKAIVTRYDGKASRRVNGSVTKVGVMGGARPRKGNVDTGHWRLLELGSVNNRANPFMRNALANNVAKVTDVFVTSLNSEIDKIIAKGRP